MEKMEIHQAGTCTKKQFWAMFESLTLCFTTSARMDHETLKSMASVWYAKTAPKYSVWVLAKAFDRATTSQKFPDLGPLMAICEDFRKQEQSRLATLEATNRPRLPMPTSPSEPAHPVADNALTRAADRIQKEKLRGSEMMQVLREATEEMEAEDQNGITEAFKSMLGPPPREGDFCGECGGLWEKGQYITGCTHAGHTDPTERIGNSQ